MVRELFILNIEGTQEELRRFLVALCCGDSQLADDIAQETLMKAYLSCDDIKDARKFKAWIFRIAYNTFLDQRRHRQNEGRATGPPTFILPMVPMPRSVTRNCMRPSTFSPRKSALRCCCFTWRAIPSRR